MTVFVRNSVVITPACQGDLSFTVPGREFILGRSRVVEGQRGAALHTSFRLGFGVLSSWPSNA